MNSSKKPDSEAIAFLAQHPDHAGQIALGQTVDHVCGTWTGLRHAHVQGSVELKREAALGSIELHRGDADVEGDAVGVEPDRGYARDIKIFDLGEDGLPRSRVDAVRGRHIGQGWWRLTDPSRVEVANGHLERVPAPRHAQLGETVDAQVETMHLPANAIATEARAVEEDGFDATPFWVDYHVRLAEPLACILLPALVLFFAVSGPPFPGPAATLLISGVLGVGYILLVAVASSLGRGGTLSPGLAGWGPVGIFTALAAALGLRMLRRL